MPRCHLLLKIYPRVTVVGIALPHVRLEFGSNHVMVLLMGYADSPLGLVVAHDPEEIKASADDSSTSAIDAKKSTDFFAVATTMISAERL